MDGSGAGPEVHGRGGAEGERATLLDYLRACLPALELKRAGLDAEQLARRSVPPFTMSLPGLVRHMADVERNWFRRVMARAGAPPEATGAFVTTSEP